MGLPPGRAVVSPAAAPPDRLLYAAAPGASPVVPFLEQLVPDLLALLLDPLTLAQVLEAAGRFRPDVVVLDLPAGELVDQLVESPHRCVWVPAPLLAPATSHHPYSATACASRAAAIWHMVH